MLFIIIKQGGGAGSKIKNKGEIFMALKPFIGITGTPTIILPDGRVHSGMIPADKLINLISGGK